MGTDDLHRKRRKERQKRLEEIRSIRASTWLIVSQGTETEPNYFNSFADFLKEHGKNEIEVKAIGIGKCPKGLVKKVEYFFEQVDREIGKVKIPYEKVCVVFDKDSFEPEDFNTAIQMGEERNYIVAWSNECFELWFLQHFDYYHVQTGREAYETKLTEILTQKLGQPTKYDKADKKIFEYLMQYGSLKDAIKNANRLLDEFCDEKSHVKKSPATNVVKLIERLMEEAGYDLE